MREKKYHAYLDSHERTILLHNLVELKNQLIQQESGGRGLDPMQASEGSFNTRYPNTPNGITDPDYSISCGV